MNKSFPVIQIEWVVKYRERERKKDRERERKREIKWIFMNMVK